MSLIRWLRGCRSPHGYNIANGVGRGGVGKKIYFWLLCSSQKDRNVPLCMGWRELRFETKPRVFCFCCRPRVKIALRVYWPAEHCQYVLPGSTRLMWTPTASGAREEKSVTHVSLPHSLGKMQDVCNESPLMNSTHLSTLCSYFLSVYSNWNTYFVPRYSILAYSFQYPFVYQPLKHLYHVL